MARLSVGKLQSLKPPQPAEAVCAEGASTVHLTEHVSDGDPANEILRMAEAEGCDLIAMGGHRGNPLNCTLNKVVRQAKCAVLTVRT